MNCILRTETPEDYATVAELIQLAFANDALSDQTEHLLVGRLRKAADYIPALSLVAEVEGRVVGHILLSKILIRDTASATPSLALAPVAVHPDWQGRGIGGQLIRESHRVATQLGHHSIVLLGHANYYPRFGYQ